MQYYSFKTVYEQKYRGYGISCTRYTPDVLCFVNGQQFGCFWISAEAAVKAAENFVDRSIEDKRKTT